MLLLSSFVGAVFLLSDIAHGQVSCRICNANTYYNGEPYQHDDCYDQVSNVPAYNCTSSDYYCQIIFELNDGLPSSVRRRCVDPRNDQDESTANMPTANECVTTISGVSVGESTTCYYSCKTDDCNSLPTTNLKQCATNCSNNIGHGDCDYFTGNCICRSGFTGSDCATAVITAVTYRSCVQCNEETDQGCASGTTSTTCPQPDTVFPYCSSAKTSTIDSTGKVVREVVTRGCTASYTHTDECSFTAPSDPIYASTHVEYTCTSMCDTNGCNTGVPNGLVDGTEEKAMYCIQCSGISGSGSCSSVRTPTRCPSASSAYCVSTVQYYISDKVDRNYNVDPDYKLINVVRACASAPVTTGCTTTTITGTTANKVTCQESCLKDGCNFGWPARPLCSSCATDLSGDINDGYDVCLNNPPPATPCSFPYQEFCTASHTTKNLISTSTSGYPQYMIRGCSYRSIGNECSDIGTSRALGYNYYNCNISCTTDGCNAGLVNGSLRPIHSVVMTSLPALFALILQYLLSV